MGQRVEQIHKSLIDDVANNEYESWQLDHLPGPVAPLVRGEADSVGGAVCDWSMVRIQASDWSLTCPPELVAAGHRVASARAHAPSLGPRHSVGGGVTKQKVFNC